MQIDNKKMVPKDVIASGLVAYLPQHPFIPPELYVRDVIPKISPVENSNEIPLRIFRFPKDLYAPESLNSTGK